LIFGIGIGAFGYAVFYWGVHHFPGIDGGQRYSLFTVLGIPQAWGMSKVGPIGLTPGGQLTAEYNNDTQTQNAENTTTGNNLTGSSGNWIGNILSGLGAPGSNNNVAKLNAWNACEGNLQGHSGLGINNPFNITADNYQPATHGDLGAVNSDGVQSFSTMTLGIQGTIAKIGEPFAKAIKANLVNDGTFSAFASAVGGSGWGTSGSCIAGKNVQVSTT
jgi:hypothetical protein